MRKAGFSKREISHLQGDDGNKRCMEGHDYRCTTTRVKGVRGGTSRFKPLMNTSERSTIPEDSTSTSRLGGQNAPAINMPREEKELGGRHAERMPEGAAMSSSTSLRSQSGWRGL